MRNDHTRLARHIGLLINMLKSLRCNILLLGICAFLAWQQVKAEEIRKGWSIGPSHMIGMNYETEFNPRWNIEYGFGLVELALAGSVTMKKYQPWQNRRFFYGVGAWAIFVATPSESGILSLGKVTSGIEWPLKAKHFWGLELSLNYPLYLATLWGPHRSFNRKTIIPLPGIYYRWTY